MGMGDTEGINNFIKSTYITISLWLRTAVHSFFFSPFFFVLLLSFHMRKIYILILIVILNTVAVLLQIRRPPRIGKAECAFLVGRDHGPSIALLSTFLPFGFGEG